MFAVGYWQCFLDQSNKKDKEKTTCNKKNEPNRN